MAGDGKGGTKLSFTMTLFPPIGSDTAEFGYTADIVDGVVPRSDVSALPVNPLESPTFAAAADSYQGGADTGAKLAEGAATIDSNLLKLRDGASELLAGLIKLRNGSEQLQTGLADEAAPGAERLADGAGQLDDGLGRIADGANQLFDGTALAAAGGDRLADGAARLDSGLTKLDGGVGDLDTGATRLAAGQKALARGLKKLYNGVDGLPQSVQSELANDQGFQDLLGALGSIARGVGSPTDSPLSEEPTLLGGINGLELGLDNPGSTPAGCQDVDPTTPCGATNALDFISVKLDGAMNGPANVDGTVAKLKATILSIKNPPNGGTCDALCQGYVDVIAAGVGTAQTTSLTDLKNGIDKVAAGIRVGITNDGAGLDRLRTGLSTGVDPRTCQANPDGCGIKEAALFLQQYGVPALVAGITDSISAELLTGIGTPTAGCDPEATLRCGAAALVAGGGDLTAGVDKLVAGVTKLNDGGALLAGGADELSSGLGELNAGADKLADGTAEAADGSGQLADGAGRLAEGLADAADGSGKLSAGLGQAADGAPKLVDGAQELSDKGTSKLVEAGEDTTQTYGQMYATMQAGAERAQTEDMAYGAPEGAIGLTAYSYVIQGEDGEAGRNWARGLAGMALLGLGGGAFLLRRRLV